MQATIPAGSMEQILNNIAKLPDEEQFLLSTCIENLLNGSHWGFMQKNVLKAYPKPLEYNNDLTTVMEVGTDVGEKRYLVEAKDPRVALKVLQKAAPSLVTKDFVEKYIKKIQESEQAFVKFVEKGSKEGFKGYIGVYSINSTNTMTFKGDRNRAFQLPLTAILNALPKLVGNVVYFVGNKTATPSYIHATYNSPTDLLKELVASDGATSVVLPVAFKR